MLTLAGTDECDTHTDLWPLTHFWSSLLCFIKDIVLLSHNGVMEVSTTAVYFIYIYKTWQLSLGRELMFLSALAPCDIPVRMVLFAFSSHPSSGMENIVSGWCFSCISCIDQIKCRFVWSYLVCFSVSGLSQPGDLAGIIISLWNVTTETSQTTSISTSQSLSECVHLNDSDPICPFRCEGWLTEEWLLINV